MHEHYLCPRRDPRLQIWTLALLEPFLSATACAATMASSHHTRGRSASTLRRTAGEEEKDSKKSNDEDRTITVPLHPFSLQFSNPHPASSVLGTGSNDASSSSGALVNAPAMDNLLGYVTKMGARTFQGSSAYGERFEGWDVGSVWSVGDGSKAVSAGAAMLSLAEIEVVRSSIPSKTTTVLTLGQNGTVTLKSRYWDDDPDPQELTEYLVQEMNADANREELLVQLRPLVCEPEDLIAKECDVGLLQAVSSDVAVESVEDEEDDVAGAGDIAHDVTAVDNEILVEAEPPVDGVYDVEQVSNGDELTTTQSYNPKVQDLLMDPVDTSTNSLGASTPSDSKYSGSAQGTLQMIVPAVIAAALVAFLVVGLLHSRRRIRRRAAREGEPLHDTSQEEATDAYDAISVPKKVRFSDKGDSSTGAATPGASVAGATSLAAAAGASPGATKARSFGRKGDKIPTITKNKDNCVTNNEQKKEEYRETSQELILPEGFVRSDSDSSGSQSSGDHSIPPEDDYSGLV